MSDDSEVWWAPSLLFDSDSREFVRGCQVGWIWSELQPGNDPEFPMTLLAYVENAEMMLRIAEALNLHVTAVETVPGEWLEVTFS